LNSINADGVGTNFESIVKLMSTMDFLLTKICSKNTDFKMIDEVD